MKAATTYELSRREALRLIAGSTLIMHSQDSAAADTLITRPIPKSNGRLPVIGLGTWQTFDVRSLGAGRAALKDVLQTFVAMGGRVIDSSPMYGKSEEVVGDLAAELKLHPKLFIATKVWTSGRQAGIRQMQESMRKLRAPKIDLMQVHNLVDAGTHLDTLAAWKAEGRVRYIGITHYTAGAHSEVISYMRRYDIDFVQINYSVGEREAERRVLPVALERRVAVIANRPFASGDLFSRVRNRALPAWAKEIDCDSWAQLFLKFIVSHPAVTCAIPATAKVMHLRDNMKAGLGRLPDAKLREKIAAAVA